MQRNLPISDSKTKDLYRKHVADEQDIDTWDLRHSLESMVIELSQSVQDTRSETRNFKSTMDTCMDDLAKVEREGLSMEEVMDLVRTLVNQTKQIRGSTLSFSSALNDAEKEISRLRSQLEQSQQAALYDALTGLCNRRYFDEELAAHDMRPHMCLILVDLDNFKTINDTHGHDVGDDFLQEIAERLQSTARSGDLTARYGGDEFILVAVNHGEKIDNAEDAIAARILNAMSGTFALPTLDLHYDGPSVGVISWQGNEVPDADELLASADKAMYMVKQKRRKKHD